MKRTFVFILIVLTMVFLILPFATTFNEFLTKIMENTGLYRLIEKYFIPYMTNIVVNILNSLPGLDIKSIPHGAMVNGVDVQITWNCLGWQSFMLFFASLIVGLKDNYTRFSKIQIIIFGLSGTFIINIFRMVFTAALVGWWNGLYVIMFHNYFMTFVSIIWLIFFWWFSYKYVLEKKQNVN